MYAKLTGGALHASCYTEQLCLASASSLRSLRWNGPRSVQILLPKIRNYRLKKPQENNFTCKPRIELSPQRQQQQARERQRERERERQREREREIEREGGREGGREGEREGEGSRALASLVLTSTQRRPATERVLTLLQPRGHEHLWPGRCMEHQKHRLTKRRYSKIALLCRDSHKKASSRSR